MFLLTYTDEACKPGVKEPITEMSFTQRIERNNLTLRTRIKRLARKTICFSRSVELYEKVIGAFIEKHLLYLLES